MDKPMYFNHRLTDEYVCPCCGDLIRVSTIDPSADEAKDGYEHVGDTDEYLSYYGVEYCPTCDKKLRVEYQVYINVRDVEVVEEGEEVSL